MSFDHREPGTDPARWTTFLDGVARRELSVARRPAIVVLAPHPDDETLGAGGLIASAGERDVAVTVVVCTDGERSHPASPTRTPDDLAAIRRDEAVQALAALHPGAALRRLGIPDGALREHRAAVRNALDDAMDAAGPGATLVAPWDGDGHRDHRIAGEVALEVARERGVELLQYPVWTWHWDDPDRPAAPWDRAVALPLGDAARERRARAFAAHRSQTGPLSDRPGDEAMIDERHAEHHLRPDEWYFAVPTSRGRVSFDAHYERHPEGWAFDSWYERRKRAVTLAALPREHFRDVLEIGCATGVLAGALVARADHVTGVDISDAPLSVARRTVPDARFLRMTVPAEWPEGEFDLVVLSEVGYYLSPEDLDATIDRIRGALRPDGVLLACHWRHPDTEAVTDAETVHGALARAWPRPATVRHAEEDFLLEVFPGPDAVSVARAAGLVR